ncbi:MAG: tetratricopeptide repeat protein [Deltaproteobacteria bacterium]|nr:tetratricopeptide repeat protein [Deltaproteobacteria bacterium]
MIRGFARLRSVCLASFVIATGTSSPALAQSEFWGDVRVPGLRAYRREVEEARRLLGRNDLANAATFAARATSRLPARPEAHVVHGQVLLASGRAADATSAFRRAFDADRRALDEPALAQAVATTAARHGDPALALAVTERAVARFPPSNARADLQRILADLLMANATDRLGAALAHYRDALRTLPRDPRVRCGLAVALARAGHEAELAQILRGARTLSDGQLVNMGLSEAEQAARRAVRAMDPDATPMPGADTPTTLWERASSHGGPWATRDREIARTIAPRFTRAAEPTAPPVRPGRPTDRRAPTPPRPRPTEW